MLKHTYLLLTVMSLLCLITALGCQGQPTPTPAHVQEPDIPANFTTYTQEGLFSISYPSGWQPALSVMEEVAEESKRAIQAQDPTASFEDMGIIFYAGELTSEGFYYPTVNIATERRSLDYWTLDEVYEAKVVWSEEYAPGYKVLSVDKVIVDGRDCIIDCSEDDEPSYGRWLYIQLFTVKGDFAWCVTCGCESNDFPTFENTFRSIVRSLRILN